MDATYWDQIRAMENRLEAGNADELIAFIRLLESKHLLSRHMFHSLCEQGFDNREAWGVLHDFAAKTRE